MSDSRSPLKFRPPTAERMAAAAALRRGQEALGPTLIDFWSWALSDLRQNAVRGHLTVRRLIPSCLAIAVFDKPCFFKS